jgi:hypothetical protein
MTLDPTPPATILTHPHYPYSPAASIASSASSSNSSVWSVASVSSKATSVASSTTTDGITAPNTAVIPPLPSRNCWQQKKSLAISTGAQTKDGLRHPHPQLPITIPEEILPIEQRQNPRRTNRLLEGAGLGCPASESCPLPPVPTLQRQADRKVNFVDNLVGT